MKVQQTSAPTRQKSTEPEESIRIYSRLPKLLRGDSHEASADHTGSFSSALGAVNAPEIQQADNDYAVALLAQTVAHSPYAKDTLIIIIEDKSQT